MKVIRHIYPLAFVLVLSITPARPQSIASNGYPFEFSQFLRDRPHELDQLLGRHISEVVPSEVLEKLPVPEEYKDPSLRYGVFARRDLHDYMKGWDFLPDKYCVSAYSMFLLFFNRGFVFKVELRFIPDSFTGSVASTAQQYCFDETPLFWMLARKFGGTPIARGSSFELTKITGKYVRTLSTGGRVTDVSWNLRGGPSSRDF
ncbi:hypothetical protein ABIB83_007970 [Bradyrhizobium sp. I1.8.5]